MSLSGIGVGLRSEHFSEFLSRVANVDWLEVLAEHLLFSKGMLLQKVKKICEPYPVALHCVGMSLGGTDPFDVSYLQELKRLVNELNPEWVSDHFSWSSFRGEQSHDLLPLPFTQEVIDHMVARIAHVQEFLQRPLLIENPSRYITPPGDLYEPEMLNKISKKSGCGILLDVNNVFVTCSNDGSDPMAYLNAIDIHAVKQMHIAGYTQTPERLIDTHGECIHDPVWNLYHYCVKRFGRVPVCLEWDNDIPAWSVMERELQKARAIFEECHHEFA